MDVRYDSPQENSSFGSHHCQHIPDLDGAVGFQMVYDMKPWEPDRRAHMKAKIDKEAARAAARLGAENVVLLAFFADGAYLHMLDGGTSPVPLAELYKKMQAAIEINQQSGGEDTKFQ